jgi:catalase
VLEAYKHCKTICALNEGVQLLNSLGLAAGKNAKLVALPTAGVLVADARKVPDGQISQDFIAAIAQHRHWNRANIEAVAA